MTEFYNVRPHVKVGDQFVPLSMETSPDIVMLEGGQNLQEYLNETSVIKYEDGKLLVQNAEGVFEEVKLSSTVSPYAVKSASNVTASITDGVIEVKWTDPNDIYITTARSTDQLVIAKWSGSKLVYKEGSAPTSINDGIVAIDNTTRDAYATNGFKLSGLVAGKTYYFQVFPYTNSGVVTVPTNDSVNVTVPIPVADDDTTGSPGPSVLKAGDKTAGFFGEVPNAEFVTPTNLASTIGLSAGTSYNTDTPWLKFILDGKILFTTKKPIRYNISWDAINTVGAAKGTKTIQVGGKTYKVRLFKGALTDPYSVNATDRGAKGSEWNRLMLPIHIQAKDKSWAHPAYVEDNVPDWNIGYTDADLLTISSAGSGSYTWCQETPSENTSNRSIRGLSGVASSSVYASSNANGYCGWRPVLELVPEEEVENELTDNTGSPGPSVLKAGDKTAGFFGEVPNTQFITPSNLASTIGLTAGTSYNTDTPWLKFSLDGKILFTTKKPIRHSISWDQINTVGAVKGTKTIQVSGKTYKVRLFKGALTDPYSYNATDKGAKGSEWNRLMLPIHAQAKDKSWVYPAYVEDTVPNWNIGYTDADLLTHSTYGDGSRTWCQETPSGYTSNRSFRGGTGVSNSNYSTSSSTHTGYGWRPLLELVQA